MKTPYNLGSIAGLEVTGRRSIFPSSSALWITLGFFAYYFLDFELNLAITGGFIAVVLHWLSEIWHQLGHAFAAKCTGYPMKGIQLWGLLSSSLYPTEEPELPASIHLRRAMGGFPANLLLGTAAALILIFINPVSPLYRYLTWFVALENIFIFGFGALVPLGFTDGSTILRYWSQR